MRSSPSTHHDAAYHVKEAERFVAASKLHHAAFHLGLARELAGAETEEAKAILPPPERPRVGSSATRQYYWSMYDRYVRESAYETSQTANDVKFRQDGYALGELPREFAARLHEAVMTAPVIRYSSAEQMTGFIAPSYDSELDSDINGHSQFRALDSAGKALLDEALVQMRDQVASFLGAPWRVIAAKCWTTPPGKPPVDMYGWHGDAWVEELFKIMIYLTPMTRRSGGLEIFSYGKEIFLESPNPGKWVLFRNSDLLHRGVPGTDSVRAVIEISLSRALAYDLRLRFPGLNPNWPELPWVDALDGHLEMITETSSPKATKIPSSTIKKALVQLVNHLGTNRRLFKWRRQAERLKRLYLSSHPQ